MKKLTLFVAALFVAQLSFAQKGVEIGLEFTPTNPWIINDEDFAEGDDLNFRGTFGFLTGLTAGYNVSDGFGIQTGFLINKSGQNYITGYDGVAKEDQNQFARKLTYMRVPVLFKVNGAGDEASGMYFRFGPHFDFLSSATYTYDDNSALDLDFELDMDDYGSNGTLFPEYEIYNTMVIGLTLEMGGQIRISDNIKAVAMLHLDGSLTNSEAADAPLVYPASGTLLAPERGNAWNVAAGITLGVHYIVPVN